MKNQKVTLINQVNHIFKKSNIFVKPISVIEIPKQTFENFDDFTGEHYIDETNPEIIINVHSLIPFRSILKTRFTKDLQNLQYKWNKKYGIDINVTLD